MNVLYVHVSSSVLTPGRVAAAFTPAKGDPKKIPNTKIHHNQGTTTEGGQNQW